VRAKKLAYVASVLASKSSTPLGARPAGQPMAACERLELANPPGVARIVGEGVIVGARASYSAPVLMGGT
jgi:hypothetical protein